MSEKSKLSEPGVQNVQHWSYTSGISDTPLLGLTIGDMFDRTVEKYPDHPALGIQSRHVDPSMTDATKRSTHE